MLYPFAGRFEQWSVTQSTAAEKWFGQMVRVRRHAEQFVAFVGNMEVGNVAQNLSHLGRLSFLRVAKEYNNNY